MCTHALPDISILCPRASSLRGLPDMSTLCLWQVDISGRQLIPTLQLFKSTIDQEFKKKIIAKVDHTKI